jgi:signal transduction histidine kinase
VRVSLGPGVPSEAEAKVVLVIEDDGKGISTNTGTDLELGGQPHEIQNIGIGLAGMRERLHQLSGHLEIASSPHGTTVRATVPLRLAAGDPPETLPHAAAKSMPAAI